MFHSKTTPSTSIQVTAPDQSQKTVDVNSIKKINRLNPNKHQINAQLIVVMDGSVHMINVKETYEELEAIIRKTTGEFHW